MNLRYTRSLVFEEDHSITYGADLLSTLDIEDDETAMI